MYGDGENVFLGPTSQAKSCAARWAMYNVSGVIGRRVTFHDPSGDIIPLGTAPSAPASDRVAASTAVVRSRSQVAFAECIHGRGLVSCLVISIFGGFEVGAAGFSCCVVESWMGDERSWGCCF